MPAISLEDEESIAMTKDDEKASLPLFYKEPEPLNPGQHGGLRLKPEAAFGFAADTNAVPVMASEFVAAARTYPIVFAGEPVMPMVVLGLETKNLFVTDGGAWDGRQTYIPAYVRRYPFCFIQQEQTFILSIDRACDRLVEKGDGYETAQPLFTDGKPSALTQDALQFCGALQNDHVATRAFAAALVEQKLLVDQAAQAVSGQGKRYSLQGFQVIDLGRLQALPDAVVADWHRKGWLALVHAHLASLLAWRDLLDRAGAAEAKESE